MRKERDDDTITSRGEIDVLKNKIVNIEERVYKKTDGKNYVLTQKHRDLCVATDEAIRPLLDTLLKDVNMFEAQYIIGRVITEYFLDKLIGIDDKNIDLLNPDNNK